MVEDFYDIFFYVIFVKVKEGVLRFGFWDFVYRKSKMLVNFFGCVVFYVCMVIFINFLFVNYGLSN